RAARTNFRNMGNIINKIRRIAKKKAPNRESKKAIKGKLIFLLAAFLIIIVLLRYVYVFYATSPYFTVKKVIVLGDKSRSSVDYGAINRMVVGKNIFKVNLDAAGSYMMNNYHELRSLEMKRAFPDAIVALVALRKPVAQLAQERYYPIDEECVVLSDVKDAPDENLPVINGINVNLPKSIGKRINSQSLRQALILFKFIKKSGILNNHVLCEINAGNLKGMSFALDKGIEVRIGYENYDARLKSLKEILADPKIWPSDIGYIDLRFGEPVIGPKWKK
ncbi:MAG: cell division protein FtsQ/DivIB, partial [Candidatus Omnitrophica bacterium]|nr:cell division protein FtsQ/DivIB [Candidatus Omnitrophota bacterium]